MAITKINDQLITSGILSPKKKKKQGIISAISMCSIDPEKTGDEIMFPISGSFKNRPERIIEILKVIDMEIENSYTPLLIHCKHGEDRSPTMVALYLFYKNKFKDFDSALEFVKNKNKKVIKPKELFVKFIKEEVIPRIQEEREKREVLAPKLMNR